MYIQYRQHYIKTAKAESQEGRFFPADGYQAILNKLNKKSKTNRMWMEKWMDIEKQAAFKGSIWHLYDTFPMFLKVLLSNVISGESAFYFIDCAC